MRADICDPNDEAAVRRFRDTVRRLGAVLEDKASGIGVNCYRMKIGNDMLIVYTDALSLDIEGPEELVQRVVREHANPAP